METRFDGNRERDDVDRDIDEADFEGIAATGEATCARASAQISTHSYVDYARRDEDRDGRGDGTRGSSLLYGVTVRRGPSRAAGRAWIPSLATRF